jgi:YggT family protein
MNALLRGLSFLVGITLDFWIWILLLRLVLQRCGASYFNPVSQLLLRLTEWLVRPTRKYLKLRHWLRFDLALSLWLIVFSCLGVWLLGELLGFMQGVPFSGVLHAAKNASTQWLAFLVFLQAIAFLAKKVIYLFFFAILIRAIISWFPNATHSPLFPLLCRMTDPLLNVFKRYIPPLGGIDFSALFALILLQLINVTIFGGW